MGSQVMTPGPQQLLTSARMIQEQGPATSRFRNAPPKTKISGEATGKLLSPVICAIPQHIGGTPRPPTMDHTVGELAASPSKRLRGLRGGPAVPGSPWAGHLGRTYSAGSARGKIAVLTSLSFRKVEGKDRGGYVFCRGREGYSDARAKFP